MDLKNIVICAFVAVSALGMSASYADRPQLVLKESLPINESEVTGVWHGYSDDGLIFAYLSLENAGTGTLAISYLPGNPVQTYSIKTWKVQGGKIDLSLGRVDGDVESIEIDNVSAQQSILFLDIKGKTWARKLTLMNQSRLMRNITAAEEKIRKSKGPN